MGQGADGDVAVQNLFEKDVKREDGSEQAFAKVDAEIGARLPNEFRGESLANIGLEMGDDLRESKSHPWPPGLEKVC
jgi:hypothetical protein